MMPLAHADPAAGGAWPYAIGLGVGYLALALRRRHDPRGWSAWRTAAFLTGSLVLAVGLTPQLLPFPDGDFRGPRDTVTVARLDADGKRPGGPDVERGVHRGHAPRERGVEVEWQVQREDAPAPDVADRAQHPVVGEQVERAELIMGAPQRPR